MNNNEKYGIKHCGDGGMDNVLTLIFVDGESRDKFENWIWETYNSPNDGRC